ncbi:Retrotransposon gag domain [Sesbania bispinosa]|nr:Retrotransposon gag domain [Sesbania bispinosa]
MLQNINQKLQQKESSLADSENGIEGNLGGQNGNKNGPVEERWRKLEIPLFSGDDAYGWVNRVERYFNLKGVREQERLQVVIVAMEGRALTWFQWWEFCTVNRTWEDFRMAVIRRFQPSMAQNPYELLLGLKQTSSVEEYREKFELYAGCGASKLRLHQLGSLPEMMDYAQRIDEKNRVQSSGNMWNGRGGSVSRNYPSSRTVTWEAASRNQTQAESGGAISTAESNNVKMTGSHGLKDVVRAELRLHQLGSLPEMMDYAQRIDEKNRVQSSGNMWNGRGGSVSRNYPSSRTVTWEAASRNQTQAESGGAISTAESNNVKMTGSQQNKQLQVLILNEVCMEEEEEEANFKDLTLKLPTSTGTMVLKGETALSRTGASFREIVKALRDDDQGFFLEYALSRKMTYAAIYVVQFKDLDEWVDEDQMKRFADKHRRDIHFEEGDWVYLKLQPYRLRSLAKKVNEKLSPRFYGPYQVIKRVGQVAYQLQLPCESRIHPVFHVSLLKKAIGPTVTPQPLPPMLSEDFELQVEPEKRLNGGRKIILDWVGEVRLSNS